MNPFQTIKRPNFPDVTAPQAPSSPCTSCFSRGARRQGLLPDWLAGFFYDKSVGGPQRDLESIVATQLFFATFILTPAVLYGSGVIHFD